MRSPARREAPSLFGEAHHLFGVVHSPVRRSAPSVRRERLSQTQCRNGCEIKKKCELVAAKRIENLIYTRAVLRCNAPASNSSTIAPPASNSSAIASPANSSFPMALSHGASASNSSATAPRQQQLRYGALASNKPHPAEKSTPVWLAIWRTWAGFANSQHRDAAFATPDNICAHSSLLPHWAAAQTDANLSAHLHRLPTPPPYLRQMRLSPGWGRRYPMGDKAVAGPGLRCLVLDMSATCPGASFLQITARANPCSRHLWGTLARAVASILAHRARC